MVSGLDHCLTSNLTAVQCIVYTSEVSVSLHLMQCVCVCVWGGGGGGGGGRLNNQFYTSPLVLTVVMCNSI